MLLALDIALPFASSAMLGSAVFLVVWTMARSLATGTHGRYASILRLRSATAPGGELARALAERDVRRTMIRVPWAPRPVRGFAGVRLHDGSGASIYATEGNRRLE